MSVVKGALPVGVDHHGDQNLYHPRQSSHYRYGYRIVGCPARFCGTESDRGKAEQAARKEASLAQSKLDEIGGPTDVDWWIQKRTSTTKVIYDDSEGGGLNA